MTARSWREETSRLIPRSEAICDHGIRFPLRPKCIQEYLRHDSRHGRKRKALCMKGYTQSGKLLAVWTILSDDPAEQQFDGDPLLLVKFEGSEGISRPFSYDVVMLRDVFHEDRPALDPSKLIGTYVKIGARSYIHHWGPIPDSKTPQYVRFGMFDSFEEVVAIDKVKLWPFTVRGFRIYRAKVVPWFSVLRRDVCYRVFERKTVVQIIDAVCTEARKTFPYLFVDTSQLQGHHFPIMEYCVQFGESTLDFLHRLMARFGIWYIFTHKTGDERYLNETMVMYGGWSQRPGNVPGVRDRGVTIDDDPGPDTVAKLVRRFRGPQRKTVVGGFNQLDPKNIFVSQTTVAPYFDFLWRNEGGPAAQTRWFATSSFAEPVETAKEAAVLASIRSEADQSGCISVSGVSRNASFVAGHRFTITSGGNDEGANDFLNEDFIIDSFSVSCHDYNYENLWGWQALDLFFDTYSTVGDDGSSDPALAKVSLWVSNAGQNMFQQFNTSDKSLNPAAAIGFGSPPDPIGGFAGPFLSALSLMVTAANFNKVTQHTREQATYANGFIALPTKMNLRGPEQIPTIDYPLPLWTRPVARGPHTAVVIGRDDGKGVEPNGNDVYCDALGRVRVRFPWDPGPPTGSSPLPPPFPCSQPNQPTTVGGNTCWVRVVEGWAGRGYGSQFLPRVGQEVLVDFLDGDPEHPVIVGRLYNADHGGTNLPFATDPMRAARPTTLADLRQPTVDNLAYSGIMTQSIPTTDTSGKLESKGFHLLRFNDTRDGEQFLMRSQWRMDVTALGNYYDTTIESRHVSIGGIDPDKKCSGELRTKIYKQYDLHVGDPIDASSGSVHALAEGNFDLHVKKGTNLALDGGCSISVGNTGTLSMHAGSIVINATKKITLSVGGASIVIVPGQIFIAPLDDLKISGPGDAPIPAAVHKPNPPEPADRGDELKPIKDRRRPKTKP